jgi:hypothetical protein
VATLLRDHQVECEQYDEQKLDDLGWFTHEECDGILVQYWDLVATLLRDHQVECE